MQTCESAAAALDADGSPRSVAWTFLIPHSFHRIVFSPSSNSFVFSPSSNSFAFSLSFRPSRAKHHLITVMVTAESGRGLPVLHALVNGETGVAYSNVLALLRFRYPHITPSFIMSDMSPAIAKAAREVMPDARHLICAFHLKQAFCRQIARLSAARRTQGQVLAGHMHYLLFHVQESKAYFECARERFKAYWARQDRENNDGSMSVLRNVCEYLQEYLDTPDRYFMVYRRDISGPTTNNVTESFHAFLKTRGFLPKSHLTPSFAVLAVLEAIKEKYSLHA